MHPSFAASAIPAPGAGMAATLDLMPAAALELDAQGVVLAANSFALTLFGCRSDALLGSSVEPYLPIGELLAYDRDLASARLEGQRANGVPIVVDTSVRRLDVDGERRALCVLHELNFAARRRRRSATSTLRLTTPRSARRSSTRTAIRPRQPRAVRDAR